ncbi:ATP-binding domain-containing protein [uncultured Ruminococcus sp.]|uniref:ATP-binding domain-containing protein n=1 Tax=uncultured Ruminococcus sp. TaxID=165186 RepID=UPI0025E4AA37|nr:ATP-binding domain-containing protein [uncultured Ruminococcus sp.]
MELVKYSFRLVNSLKLIINNGFKKASIICRDLETKQYLLEIVAKLNMPDLDVMLYTTYEAKGLEFDAVIVIDTYKQDEKELLYTACTRAQHQLIVFKTNSK